MRIIIEYFNFILTGLIDNLTGVNILILPTCIYLNSMLMIIQIPNLKPQCVSSICLGHEDEKIFI